MIQMLERKHESRVLAAVDDLLTGAVHVVADPLPRRKNHHQHPMKILVMNRKAEKDRHRHVAEVHEAVAVNQKNQKNPNYLKRMTKNCQNPEAIEARFVLIFILCINYHNLFHKIPCRCCY